MLQKYFSPFFLLWRKYRTVSPKQVVRMVLLFMAIVICVGWLATTLQIKGRSSQVSRTPVALNPDIAGVPYPNSATDQANTMVEALQTMNQTVPATTAENHQAMIWQRPVLGRLLREYGWQYMPLYDDWRFYPGITIRTEDDAMVESACRGLIETIDCHENRYTVTVVQADWKVVYADLSEVRVAAGHEVSVGNPIGKTGRTVEQPVPHLSIFMYQNGQPINPLHKFQL